MFFSGFIIPVSFFPSWLADIARLLPFVAIVQLPLEIFLGLQNGAGAIAGVLAVQVLWAVVLLGIGRVVLARATRKVVVQGG
jgi:ABC-2 type transport system permease protein